MQLYIYIWGMDSEGAAAGHPAPKKLISYILSFYSWAPHFQNLSPLPCDYQPQSAKPNPKKLKPINHLRFLTHAPRLQTFNTSTLFLSFLCYFLLLFKFCELHVTSLTSV